MMPPSPPCPQPPPDRALRPTRSPSAAEAGSSRSDGRPFVMLYTDGACSGNPGPGGWAYVLRHPASGATREDSGGEARTTNNRMELTAVIEGLRALSSPSRVEIHADSQYVLNGLREWMDGWKKRGWTRSRSRQPVLNVELWQELDRLRALHDLSYHWVKGHSGHPENERCDELARAEIARFRP